MTRHFSASKLDPRGKTLPQLLLQRGRQDADTLAQRHKSMGIWKRYTWSDVLEAVTHCSIGLAALGLKRGDVVAIIGENEPELFRADLAALAQGALVVCLYPDQSPDEMAFILSDSGARFLFAQDQEQTDKVLSVLDQLPAIEAIIFWDPKGLWTYNNPKLHDIRQLQARGAELATSTHGAFEAMVASGKPTDPAVLLYSSGTTGRPKGIQVSHNYLLDNALRILGGAKLRAGAEYLSYISPAWGTEHVFGVSIGLINPMVVNFPERPESVLHDLREIGVECLCFTPRQWESLASDQQAKLLDAVPFVRAACSWALGVGQRYAESQLTGASPSVWTVLTHFIAETFVLRPLRDQLGLKNVQIAVSGGAAMAPDVFRLFHSMGVPLRNAYGLTEFGWIAMHREKYFDLETVGSLLPVDPAYGEPLQWLISEEGELLLRGGTGFEGYHGLPEKTRERWKDGWLRTGDHCAITSSGELLYYERMEDLRTLSTGVRYPPQFIETRLRFSPFIKDVMVVGDESTPYPVALINIDAQMVGRWAEERGIGYSTFADLSQRPEVRELIRSEIARVNTRLEEGARVVRFANLPKELDADEGELTRTRKLRRGLLVERYAALIKLLYSDVGELVLELEVKYRDGRTSNFRAEVWSNACDSSRDGPDTAEPSARTSKVGALSHV